MAKNWELRRLNELGFVSRGKSRHRPRNSPELYGGPYPFVQTADIMNSEFRITTYSQTYSEAGLAQSKLWEPNTLCITNAGANTGESAILGIRACFPDSVIAFIADDSKSDVRFVKYYLDTIIHGIRAITRGATQDNLSVDKLLTFDIPTPPVPIQRKIASILSVYNDLIENNSRRIAILEEMAQAIYREWFVNFRFPGHENVKLVDSPIGQIPERWEATTVGDLATNERRSIKPRDVDPETPYIGLEHIPRKSITLSEWGFATDIESTKHRFCEGEILFGKIRPYFHKVAVAPFDGICSSDAIVIVPRQDEYFPTVLCCVSSVPFVDHATQTSQGTKMPRANWDVLTKYPLPLPPTDILGKFNEVVSDIVSSLKNLMLKNRNLRTTRDLLLPKLISGKLDVEDLDIDVGELIEELEEVIA